MHLGLVVGKVISTQKAQYLVGGKLLVVRIIDTDKKFIEDESPYVAVDGVGAGVGDTVLVDWAGSVDNRSKMVGDMSIVGIVDSIQLGGNGS